MARINYVKKAQQRYFTKPVLNEDGTQKITPVMRKNGTPKTTKKGQPIVLRVTENDLDRPKPNQHCDNCRKEITPGMPYKWVSIKSSTYGSRTMVRCMECRTWKPSQLTTSNRGIAMAAIEDAQEALDSWTWDDGTDALEEIVHEAAAGVREYAEMCEESATNMEDGFGHETYQSSELRDRAQEMNDAADELENWSCDVDTDEARWVVTIDGTEENERYASEAEAQEFVDQYLEDNELTDDDVTVTIEEDTEEPSWADEARDEAQGALDNVEL